MYTSASYSSSLKLFKFNPQFSPTETPKAQTLQTLQKCRNASDSASPKSSLHSSSVVPNNLITTTTSTQSLTPPTANHSISPINLSPSTPINHREYGVDSNDGDVSSTSPFLVKKRVGKTKGVTFNTDGMVRSRFSSSSGDSGWFSSEEDDIQFKLQHSRNLSKRKAATLGTKSDKVPNFGTKSGVMESIVIEKRSEDPYADFKKSMVEMIVEKGIVEIRDLEDLLQCFLTLNSRQHYQVIVEAFTAIWDARFSQSPPSFRGSES